LPVIDRNKYNSAEGVAKGAYVLLDTAPDFSVILIATGSEVSLALQAQQNLLSNGVHSRVVSSPCLEWFAEQSAAYQESVIPPSIKARVSIEAGIAMPWYRIIGDAGVAVSLEHFGASADAKRLFKEYGFTAENIVSCAMESIAKAK
jgi:transketolase